MSESWRVRERFGSLRSLELELKAPTPKPTSVPHVNLPTRKERLASVAASAAESFRPTHTTARVAAVGPDQLPIWSAEVDMSDSLDKVYDSCNRNPAFDRLRGQSELVRGVGPAPDPQLMILLGTPTESGQMVTGQASNILASMLYGSARIHLKDCFVTSCLKYRPRAGVNDFTQDEFWESVPYLRRELALVMPKGGVVVLAGSTPLQLIYDYIGKNLGECHGQRIVRGSYVFVPTYAPSHGMTGLKRTEYAQDFDSVAVALREASGTGSEAIG